MGTILESWRENRQHSRWSCATTSWLQTAPIFHQSSYMFSHNASTSTVANCFLVLPQFFTYQGYCHFLTKLTTWVWFFSIQTYVLSLVRITFSWSFIAFVVRVTIAKSAFTIVAIQFFKLTSHEVPLTYTQHINESYWTM